MAKLGDYISIKHGYAFKGDGITTEDNGVVLVTPGNFSTGGGFKEEKCKFFSDQYSSDFVLSPGDLIVTMTDLSKEMDTLGYSALVPKSNRVYLHNQRIGLISINREGLDKHYLYWFMRSRDYQRTIAGGASGTTVHHTSPSRICEVQINFPDLLTQKKIARLLDSLEDKIQNNNKINNNLLEQALTLYATHFSSLDKNGCIGDYCAVKSGFAFKSSWWTNSGVKVIKIGSINQDNLNLLECSYVDEDKADKTKEFVVKAGDLLIAMTGATIGKFAMVPYSSEVLLVNQRVGKFFLGNNPAEKLPFIYCTLKQPEVYGEVVNRGQGSAQPNISASDIMSIPCVIPRQEAINDFNDTAQPLFDLIISNQRENQQLSELRNALLPKLMSGELDVSNIDI